MHAKRTNLILASLLASAFIVAAGCEDDETPSGTGGSGGGGAGGAVGGAGGGAGGTGGGAGGAGGAAGSCQYPACVSNLGKNCVPSGACMYQTQTAAMGQSAICYANGVKYLTSFMPVGMTGGFQAVTRVTKTDGSTCSTVETTGMSGASMNQFTSTYKDGEGKPVATVKYEEDGSQIITCVGEAPVTVKGCPVNNDPSKGADGQASCTQGTCM